MKNNDAKTLGKWFEFLANSSDNTSKKLTPWRVELLGRAPNFENAKLKTEYAKKFLKNENLLAALEFFTGFLINADKNAEKFKITTIATSYLNIGYFDAKNLTQVRADLLFEIQCLGGITLNENWFVNLKNKVASAGRNPEKIEEILDFEKVEEILNLEAKNLRIRGAKITEVLLQNEEITAEISPENLEFLRAEIRKELADSEDLAWLKNTVETAEKLNSAKKLIGEWFQTFPDSATPRSPEILIPRSLSIQKEHWTFRDMAEDFTTDFWEENQLFDALTIVMGREASEIQKIQTEISNLKNRANTFDEDCSYVQGRMRGLKKMSKNLGIMLARQDFAAEILEALDILEKDQLNEKLQIATDNTLAKIEKTLFELSLFATKELLSDAIISKNISAEIREQIWRELAEFFIKRHDFSAKIKDGNIQK